MKKVNNKKVRFYIYENNKTHKLYPALNKEHLIYILKYFNDNISEHYVRDNYNVVGYLNNDMKVTFYELTLKNLVSQAVSDTFNELLYN